MFWSRKGIPEDDEIGKKYGEPDFKKKFKNVELVHSDQNGSWAVELYLNKDNGHYFLKGPFERYEMISYTDQGPMRDFQIEAFKEANPIGGLPEGKDVIQYYHVNPKKMSFEKLDSMYALELIYKDPEGQGVDASVYWCNALRSYYLKATKGRYAGSNCYNLGSVSRNTIYKWIENHKREYNIK